MFLFWIFIRTLKVVKKKKKAHLIGGAKLGSERDLAHGP